MKQLILSLSLAAFLLSCKKTDSTPTNTTPNKDTTQTSIAKYGAGVTDIDGNKYKTVIIGTQEWMGENLKVSKYNDGVVIPNVIGVDKWSQLTTGAWCNLKNSDSLGKIYGKLYNWYAVDTKKLCPTGWHVPNYDEWLILIKNLNVNFKLGVDDTISAQMMKVSDTKYWESPNTANNISLFSALPAGQFPSDASDAVDGFNIHDTGWWSTTEFSDGGIFFLGIDYKYTVIDHVLEKLKGISVRCLKN
jgi:uncharacterized protein (TIGR02145 family)